MASSNRSHSQNGAKSAKHPFKYGFKVHSVSQVNQSPKSTKKTKKSPSKSRNKTHQLQQQQSPFSTTTSTETPIELTTSSVSTILDSDHLDASSALSLHDLQCGTGRIVLQAFLSYRNLRRVFGIEQNKNLFHWATANLLSLIKNGYKSRKYLLVEQMPSLKMTIAEKMPSSSKSFSLGEIVYCFIPLKEASISKRDNYQGIVKAVSPDGIHYDILMSSTKTIASSVHVCSVFKPGTERILSIIRGNLFEVGSSFRSDIILLPSSHNNDSFKSLLLTGCKRSPIKSRILSFGDLSLWDGFPSSSLRRIDANVYDSDRYCSSVSPFSVLFMYSHTLSPSLASSPKDIVSRCVIGSEVTVRDCSLQEWFTASVIDIDLTRRLIAVNRDGFIGDSGIESIAIDEQRVHLIERRFNIGDLIICNSNNTLYRAQIMAINAEGTYCVQFEDGETHPKVNEICIFKYKKCKYSEGELCIAYRYDRGEDVVERNECIIRHCNPNGSYRIEFVNIATRLLHDSFCELWLKPLSECADNLNLNYIEAKLPLIREIDYDRVLLWKSTIVCHWLSKCGISQQSIAQLRKYKVNGVWLFDLDIDLLNEMHICEYDAVQIMRYMRALRSKLQYNIDEEDEEIATISLEIQECDRDIKHLQKLLINITNNDEYIKYREWELKMQCIQLYHKKVNKKDIAKKLKKKQQWVNKICKLKINQIKKPNANIIKQFDAKNEKIFKFKKQIKEKQNQMIRARQKLQQFIDD